MGINLNNIESDGVNKKDISKEIEGYVKRFYGGTSIYSRERGLIDAYNDENKKFIESIKVNFIEYFKNELKNFNDIQELKNPERIVARANDSNKIILSFSSQDLTFLNFDLSIDGKIINKEYRIDVESNFKNPNIFKLENKNNGLGKKITCYRWEIDSIAEHLNTIQLQEALSEIKDIVEFNQEIIHELKFNISVYENAVNKHDDLIINVKSIQETIKFLFDSF